MAVFEFEENTDQGAKIKVIGIGGGGGNAINTMVDAELSGVIFIAANTDSQALRNSTAHVKMQLGCELTKGLGAGSDPEVGRNATIENKEDIREIISGVDMVFVTAGLGGGTGTGGAPIVAEIARDEGILTVGVVTKPFLSEGPRRMAQAEEGLRELRKVVDTLITIPNQRLLNVIAKNTPIMEAFGKVDEILLNAVKGICDLILIPGLINLDFADVRTVMKEMGMAMMGIGVANGDNRAVQAAQSAISSPLLEDVSIDGARGVLVNITGGSEMSLYEVNEALSLIYDSADKEANIIFGAVIEESLGDEVRVTVIATGFGDKPDMVDLKKMPHDASRRADVDHVPAFIRKKEKAEYRDYSNVGVLHKFPADQEDEYDIPTFLRRQAD